MNKKGFVLTEVIVVAVFIVTIFIFIYSSIIPLTGIYQDKAEREENIDIVYKLYHIRNMIKRDNNSEEITNSNVKIFRCSDLANQNYCNELMEELQLSRYTMAYIKNINDNLEYFRNYNSEIYDYLKDYTSQEGDAILLFDNAEHTIAHIKYTTYNIMGVFPEEITSLKGNITKIYFNSFNKQELNNRYNSSNKKADVTYDNQGKVLAWLEQDTNNSGRYILYVGSVGKTYLSTGYHLFENYSNLQEIYFNNIDTSQVLNMSYMFYGCSSLTSLDISSFNVNGVTNSSSMFADCLNLSTIYAANDINFYSSTNDTNMFYNSTLIVGGNGTIYDESFVDKTYARVDKVGARGYFTAKS